MRVLALSFAIALAGCTCGTKRHEEGGVTIEERRDGFLLKSAKLTVSFEGSQPTNAITITPWPGRPSLTIEASLGGVRKLVDRELFSFNGAAAIRHRLEGTDAELIFTIDPAASTFAIVARAPRLDPGAKLAVRVTTTPTAPIVLESGAAYAVNDALPSRSHFVNIGAPALLIASKLSLDLETTQPGKLTTVASAEARASDGVEVRVDVAAPDSTRDGNLLGARLGATPPRTGGDVLIETRDGKTLAPLPTRVWIDGTRRVPGPAFVVDPSRDAEKTAPIIDVTTPRTVVSLPEGSWSFRATRGPGWSVARKDLAVVAGDVARITLDLVEETPLPDTIGCDFHVHARPSFDATAVSYEDRVRSLAAVGVECAAATEHDHVGDHGPAAAALHLDDRFRALSGVELTTVAGGFGHFNVYPWPSGAKIPETRATTPNKLFDAVHALPGSFVFQLNHPRMGKGPTGIGYFNFVALDAKAGTANGPYPYRRDYDAIEVFNGYDLRDLGRVRALINEWVLLLDRDEVHVATGSSDSHGITFPWAGFPRTMVRVGPDWRTGGRPIDGIVDAVKKGRAYVTSGPLLDLHSGAATLGDTASGAKQATLKIAATTWLGAPKVTVFVGAAPIAAPAPRRDGDQWVVDIALPTVTRKRALVVVVESPLTGEAPGLVGFENALAVTNPIWLTP